MQNKQFALQQQVSALTDTDGEVNGVIWGISSDTPIRYDVRIPRTKTVMNIVESKIVRMQ